MSWSGDGHDHWHVLGFQEFKLVSLDRTVLGNVAKIGFCSFDSYPYTSPKTPWFTGERDICQTNDDGKVLMGTSRGWGDIYRWSIAFQWIDITGLPNGKYKVRVVIDPPIATGGFFRESDESNNRSWTKIRIGSSGVTVLSQSRNP
jgi:Lysyl oxidase